MAAQTVPELALSESDEHDVNDLGEGPLSGDFREVEYDPSHVWIEDPDDPMEPPPALSQWDKNGWDDTALVSVWAAATEEFIRYNDPTAPFVPFEVDEDLIALSKQTMKDSWKIKMKAREQIERAAWEEVGLPPRGTRETTNLWYYTVARPKPKSPYVPKKPVNPYLAAPVSKKRKITATSSATADDPEYRLQSPEPYEGGLVSPPAWEPEEPTFGDEIEDEEVEYAAVSREEMIVTMGDRSEWDDSDLVQGWEQEKQAWQEANGTTKTWLDLALEEKARADAAVEDATEDATEVNAGATSSAEKIAAVPPLKLDKVARRNLERFKNGAAAAGSMPTEPEELSYD